MYGRGTFETLKIVVAIIHMLKIFNPDQAFELEMDASGEDVGAILKQRGCPIAFESKKLNHTLRNYSSMSKNYLQLCKLSRSGYTICMVPSK